LGPGGALVTTPKQEAQKLLEQGRQTQNTATVTPYLQRLVDDAYNNNNQESLDKAMEIMYHMKQSYDAEQDKWMVPFIEWYNKSQDSFLSKWYNNSQIKPQPQVEAPVSPSPINVPPSQAVTKKKPEEGLKTNQSPTDVKSFLAKQLKDYGFASFGDEEDIDAQVETALQNPAGIGIPGITNKDKYLNFLTSELSKGGSESGSSLRDVLGDMAPGVLATIVDMQGGNLAGYSKFKQLLSQIPQANINNLVISTGGDPIAFLDAFAANFKDSLNEDDMRILNDFNLMS